ncbi:MAG: hypothetical protein Ct9H300mP21_05280 [Pseudomonadota bacterium]|nr:MAG: hypothetical protein Ct9H300mP21_05280 [Pseudomonadota bacterium]
MGKTEEAYKLFMTGFNVEMNFWMGVWVAGDNTRQSYISLHRPGKKCFDSDVLSLDDERTARIFLN